MENRTSMNLRYANAASRFRSKMSFVKNLYRRVDYTIVAERYSIYFSKPLLKHHGITPPCVLINYKNPFPGKIDLHR
jgi:hypothetical protein